MRRGAAAWLRLNRRLSVFGWVSGAIEEISTRPGRDGRLNYMKKIGFLSFDHWTPCPQSGTRSSADALLRSIDLAVEAERLGMNGAYFRVHHFAQPLALCGSDRITSDEPTSRYLSAGSAWKRSLITEFDP
jgi:hypothetical protein